MIKQLEIQGRKCYYQFSSENHKVSNKYSVTTNYPMNILLLFGHSYLFTDLQWILVATLRLWHVYIQPSVPPASFDAHGLTTKSETPMLVAKCYDTADSGA